MLTHMEYEQAGKVGGNIAIVVYTTMYTVSGEVSYKRYYPRIQGVISKKA